jgi:large subunit ribosomal protein L19
MTSKAESILKLSQKTSVPDIEVGDVVRVHQKIREGNKERIQVFEGIVIATNHGKGVNASFTVRKISSGIGVEKVFLLHSPNITKVEFKRGSNIKRAKLYYLRALTGKALKMKDKTSQKEAWAEVLGQDTEAKIEATEEDIAEAVQAEEKRKAAEAQLTETNEAEDNQPSTNNDESEQQPHETEGEDEPVAKSDAGAGDNA